MGFSTIRATAALPALRCIESMVAGTPRAVEGCLRSGSAAVGAAVASACVTVAMEQSNRSAAPRSSHFEAAEPCGLLVVDLDPVDVGAAGAVAHEPDHRVDHLGVALEHGLDRALLRVAHPAGDAAALGLLARGVAEEDALHLAVGHHPPADRHAGTVASVATVEVLDTDITALEVDAIANAANTDLAHGGGVAGAIARAGGPEVQRESDEQAPIGLGEAVETTAGEMPSRWVIHAATMHLGGPTSEDIIRRATASTLTKADELGAKSLALVAFGTGVGGFPLADAARVEVEEVRRHLEQGSALERVVFAVHGEAARAAFEAALES